MKLSSTKSFNPGGFFASSGSLGVYSELQILMALFPHCETCDHEPCHQEECLPAAGGARLIKTPKGLGFAQAAWPGTVFPHLRGFKNGFTNQINTVHVILDDFHCSDH